MSSETIAHPAPHRHRVGKRTLWLGLCGAPLTWAAQMTASETISSHGCFPHQQPLSAPVWPGMMDYLGLVSALALLLVLAINIIIWRTWRRIGRESRAGAHHAVDIGEGRTRFIVVLGIMAAMLFTIAILFTACAYFMVPPCRPWF